MDSRGKAYMTAFNTPAGKAVMQDLKDKYDRYTTEEGDALKTYGKSASRDVYLYIRFLSEGKDE